MRRPDPLLLALVALAALAAAAPGAHAQAPSGLWRQKGSAVELRFQPCGDAVCGVIVASARLAADPDERDAKNPDPKLRSRPLRGVAMLDRLKPSGDLWKGRVYLPSTGAAYPVTVRRVDADTLTATGCVAPLLCQTSTLIRQP